MKNEETTFGVSQFHAGGAILRSSFFILNSSFPKVLHFSDAFQQFLKLFHISDIIHVVVFFHVSDVSVSVVDSLTKIGYRFICFSKSQISVLLASIVVYAFICLYAFQECQS